MRVRMALALTVLFCFAGALTSEASESVWPSRPVRIIAAASAGGGVDFVARIAAQTLTEQLRQNFVVENRGGAGGTIAVDQVAKAAPDGYTLLVSANAELTLSPHVRSDLPYDPLRDLAPIMLIASAPTVVLVHPAVPAQNVPELIAYARGKGGIGYGTPGAGSNAHINFELLRHLSSLPFFHVPYKGGGPAMADLVGGQLQVALVNTPPSMGAIQAGTVRPLAVMQPSRSSLLPEVPTLKEAAGLDARDASSWFAIMAPARTPQDVIQRLQSALMAISTTSVRERLAKGALDVIALPGARFGERMRAESEANAAAVKRIGFKLQ